MEFINVAEEITEADIAAFEAKFGYQLPDDYKQHMLRNNGGQTTNNVFVTPNGDEYVVASFYSINHGENSIDELLDIDAMDDEPIMDLNMFPFADDPYGNNYCINMLDGAIYLWFHDMEGEVVPLADSFTKFLEGLQKGGQEYLF